MRLNKTVRFRGSELVYTIDGAEVAREVYEACTPDKEIGEPLAAQTTGCWPMASEAVAVHPKQVEEAHRVAREKGVPTEYDKVGRPVFTDRGHRKAYLKAFGVKDNQGGYGD